MAISLIKTGRQKGLYRVRIQPVDPKTGKIIKIPSVVTKGKTKSEAHRLEKDLWAKYHGTTAVDSHLDEPLSVAFEKYVETSYENGKWEYTTYCDWHYTSKLVKQFFGREKVKDVRESDINDFVHQYVKQHHTRLAKHATVERQQQNLRAFFTRMQRYGLGVNPVPRGALNEFFRKGQMMAPNKKYVFTEEEVSATKKEIQKEFKKTPFTNWGSRLGIMIALETGMRPQEIQALRWDELVKENEFTVFKIDNSWCERTHNFNGHLKSRMQGESRKTLALSSEVLELLKDFHHKQVGFLKRKGICNTNNLILLNLTDYTRCKRGFPIAQRSMNDELKVIIKKVGVNNGALPVSMYTCRHTVATRLGNTPNMSYPWAASRMGHSLQMFMDTYVHSDAGLDDSMLKLVSSQHAEEI